MLKGGFTMIAGQMRLQECGYDIDTCRTEMAQWEKWGRASANAKGDGPGDS